MWIQGKDGLINMDTVIDVYINVTQRLAILQGGTDGLHTPVIDEFEGINAEEEALAARRWLLLLLQGLIPYEVWEKGRYMTTDQRVNMLAVLSENIWQAGDTTDLAARRAVKLRIAQELLEAEVVTDG
jgi:hypothetical protein